MTRERTRILFLETLLDEALDSTRSEIRFLREFFENFSGIEFDAREVHSRADLEKFLGIARAEPSIRAVHIVSHGERAKAGSSIMLTRDEEVSLADRQNVRMFRDLAVDVLFMSCCQLGADTVLMERLLLVSGANAVFGYVRSVTDYQAFLVEGLFYHLAYGYLRGASTAQAFVEVYERLRVALDMLRIDTRRDALADPLVQAAIATPGKLVLPP